MKINPYLSSTPVEDYGFHRDAYTHGRCRPCGIVFAWRFGKRRRLKDCPHCPECGALLTRTCAALLKSKRVQIRNPLWDAAEVIRLRASRSKA